MPAPAANSPRSAAVEAPAVSVAVDMVSERFNDRIIEGLKRFSESLNAPRKAAV